jgi:Protein of unknown function (DUF3048) N-terminal domain/Protein of unknown function (DUF3048) C-terminal domain
VPRLTTFLVVLGALALAACSRAPAAEPTATLPPTTTLAPTIALPATTTTTLPPTTTTTEPAAFSPLNGVPVRNDKWLERRVMAIKIDNHPNARPQSGLLDSDLVIEEEAEGGITRFIALFLQSDSENLGPMRSVRPTDIGFLSPLDAAIGYSGGQPWIKEAVNAAGIPAIGETRENEATWRISSRYAPHNLYVNTHRMRELADERGFPDDPPETGLLTFGKPPRGVSGPASAVHLDWAFGNNVDWEWDEDEGLWVRSQQGSEHTWIDAEDEEKQIGVETLVILEAPDYTAYPSGSGTPVPATETTGTGRALVFHDGKVIEGTWERETVEEGFKLEVDDRPLRVPPGEVWLTMHPDDMPAEWTAAVEP